jgi:hypothetical protein
VGAKLAGSPVAHFPGAPSAHDSCHVCLGPRQCPTHLRRYGPHCTATLPHIRLVTPKRPGRLRPLTFQDIPWDQIAFSSIQIALRAYCDDLASGRASYRHGTILKTPGSAPNDPAAFRLVDCYAFEIAPVAVTSPSTAQ